MDNYNSCNKMHANVILFQFQIVTHSTINRMDKYIHCVATQCIYLSIETASITIGIKE